MSLPLSVPYICRHPLASKHKAAALIRYFKWQLGSRLLPFPIAVPFAEGTSLVVERGMRGATGNIYCGLHEFQDMGFLLHFLRPEDTFMDIGANVGSYTVLASGVCGAKSLALEPLPGTFEKLLRNLRYNDLEGLVEAHCCAAGGSHTELSFSVDNDTLNRVVEAGYTGRSIKVPVRPLNAFLEEVNTVMWKVDVEGFEPDVMVGANKILSQPSLQAVVIEGQQLEVRAAMQGAGFNRARYDPFSRLLEPIRESGKDSQNALWVRNFAFVEQRCRSARAVTVAGVRF